MTNGLLLRIETTRVALAQRRRQDTARRKPVKRTPDRRRRIVSDRRRAHVRTYQ